jgi:hypothetical protein
LKPATNVYEWQQPSTSSPSRSDRKPPRRRSAAPARSPKRPMRHLRSSASPRVLSQDHSCQSADGGRSRC